MPIRWLAPETLRQGVFSTKTDVYSFGVMMWEVYSHCKSDPYPGMSNAEARMAIQTGRTVESPQGMPAAAQALMESCFKMRPEERPTFSQVARRLESDSEETPNQQSVHLAPF